MTFSDVLQLEMPARFPVDAFQEFWTAAREVLPYPSDLRTEFNRASNLIGWRYRNCIEYSQAFTESWHRIGVAASFEEQYARERDLFGMFVAGISTVESICYATYSLCAGIPALQFPFAEKDRRRATPHQLRQKLARHVPAQGLTQELSGALASPEWLLWNNYRNTMAHRSSIPRVVRGAIGGAPPPAQMLEYSQTWSTEALSGDEGDLQRLLGWLDQVVAVLLRAGAQLTRTV